jgi:hypothetical protein
LMPILEHRQGFPGDRVAGVGETDRGRDAVLPAPLLDGSHLGRQVVHRLGIDTHVVAGVVADLEPVFVQSGDLVRGHVHGLVGCKVPAFGDEKRRPDSVRLEGRPGHGEVRLAGVVERQHDELVGDRVHSRRQDGGEEGRDEGNGGADHVRLPGRGERGQWVRSTIPAQNPSRNNMSLIRPKVPLIPAGPE